MSLPVRMPRALAAMPVAVQRQILHFEAAIHDAVVNFAARLPAGARVLDAGAGEGNYARFFTGCRYTGVDLGIGDEAWNYRALDAVADLTALPFAGDTFDASLNIVTLEHVREPARVLVEIARVLRPGASLLLATPHQWEEHQQPHDYYRYTRFGLEHLLRQAGLEAVRIDAAGGLFRMLSRRLWNAVQLSPPLMKLPAALLLGPLALLLPAFDGWDRDRRYTLGHICIARKL